MNKSDFINWIVKQAADVANYNSVNNSKNWLPADIAELNNRSKNDQLIRGQKVVPTDTNNWTHQSSLDQNNTTWLREKINQGGWPKNNAASTQAWNIAQHADHDPGFQRNAIEQMGSINPRSPQLAQLIDRHNINIGIPQVYGTINKITLNPKTQAWSSTPHEISDRRNLDQLRGHMGLGSFDKFQTEQQNILKTLAKPN